MPSNQAVQAAIPSGVPAVKSAGVRYVKMYSAIACSSRPAGPLPALAFERVDTGQPRSWAVGQVTARIHRDRP